MNNIMVIDMIDQVASCSTTGQARVRTVRGSRFSSRSMVVFGLGTF